MNHEVRLFTNPNYLNRAMIHCLIARCWFWENNNNRIQIWQFKLLIYIQKRWNRVSIYVVGGKKVVSKYNYYNNEEGKNLNKKKPHYKCQMLRNCVWEKYIWNKYLHIQQHHYWGKWHIHELVGKTRGKRKLDRKRKKRRETKEEEEEKKKSSQRMHTMEKSKSLVSHTMKEIMLSLEMRTE